MMEYKEFDDLKIDFVLGKLSEEKTNQVSAFLVAHPSYKNQIKQLELIFQTMENLEEPVPSNSMDENFYAFLSDQTQSEMKHQTQSDVEDRFYFSINKTFLKALGFGLMMMIIGFFIGNNLNTKNKVIDQTNLMANEETELVRKQLVMALIGQNSANKRLQAVNEAAKLDKVTETIVNALFRTLNYDENINVRLAAVASLAKYTKNPLVREGLILAMDGQDSPLVQIAMADLMVKIQDKNSLEPMRKMLEKPDINEAVRQKLEESIEKII